jgi:hypothetical protein
MHRLELQLNPANAEAHEIIKELEALPKEYGRNSEFLKERLVRGFRVFAREVDALRGEPDPFKALDTRAKSGAEFKAQYRLLQVMLGLPTVAADPASGEPQQPIASPKVATKRPPREAVVGAASVPAVAERGAEAQAAVILRRPVAEAGGVSPEVPAAAPFAPVSEVALAAEPQAFLPATTDQGEPAQVSKSEPHDLGATTSLPQFGSADAGDTAAPVPGLARPTRDWSAFRGLAGTTKQKEG